MSDLGYCNFKDKKLQDIDMEIEEVEDRLHELKTQRRKYIDNKKCDHLYESVEYNTFEHTERGKIITELIRCVKCGKVSKLIR